MYIEQILIAFVIITSMLKLGQITKLQNNIVIIGLIPIFTFYTTTVNVLFITMF